MKAQASRLHRDTADQIAAVPSSVDGSERELMANEPSTSGHKLATLRSPTRCHFCGSTIAAGSLVQWHRTSPRRASKHHTIAARNVACCAGSFPGECEATQRATERAGHEAAIAAMTDKIAALLKAGRMDEARAMLGQS